MAERQKIALISVYDKAGIADFARALVALGWRIVSSGGTAKHLADAGIPVTDAAELTGMPPILSHRVATLHPKIHGGLLALDTTEHLAEMEKYGIPWIDMVCVDFYPLEEAIAAAGATRDSVIEKTDIGGPTMVRSAAKGRRITICDPADRERVIEWLRAGEPERDRVRTDLAAKAEVMISRYTALSAGFHSGGAYQGLTLIRAAECAYGENAYQAPAYLHRRLGNGDPLALHNWQHVAGSAPSYNNYCDLDRMIQTMTHIGAGFEKNFGAVPNTAIGVKHGNACGAGTGDQAAEKMLLGDLRAIFGGSVMLNFAVDEAAAELLIHKFMPEGQRRLLDVVAAPSFTPEAVEILSRKKGKCRLLANPAIARAGLASLDVARRFRYVRGGFLEQPNYAFVPALADRNLVLAWAVGATSNSNTITIVKDGRLAGNGVGQQDRVGAAKLAIFRADESWATASALLGAGSQSSAESAPPAPADLTGAVAYSDSFFPFPDAPRVLIDRGIKKIFATSGSVNDDKTVELCRERGVELVLLPDAEARGFYQH